MTDQNEKRKPSLNVFAKVLNGRDTRIGPQIGVAFKHGEGEGYNILLDAQPIPIDGRIELVAFPPKQ
jgi:hypothetical protein